MSTQTEKATFAAGCFWGVEHKFRQLNGVLSTQVGYIGGQTDEPNYEEVCRKGTGHAEAVEITFDPAIISYEELLATFWKIHNPTQLNRQGPDVGDQYRSAVFYHSTAQKELAETTRQDTETSKIWGDAPIVTQIAEAGRFWRAEEYHQQYVEKKGGGSCAI